MTGSLQQRSKFAEPSAADTERSRIWANKYKQIQELNKLPINVAAAKVLGRIPYPTSADRISALTLMRWASDHTESGLALDSGIWGPEPEQTVFEVTDEYRHRNLDALMAAATQGPDGEETVTPEMLLESVTPADAAWLLLDNWAAATNDRASTR